MATYTYTTPANITNGDDFVLPNLYKGLYNTGIYLKQNEYIVSLKLEAASSIDVEIIDNNFSPVANKQYYLSFNLRKNGHDGNPLVNNLLVYVFNGTDAPEKGIPYHVLNISEQTGYEQSGSRIYPGEFVYLDFQFFNGSSASPMGAEYSADVIKLYTPLTFTIVTGTDKNYIPQAGHYNGTSYDSCIPMYYNGTNWIECEWKYYNGSNWQNADSQ